MALEVSELVNNYLGRGLVLEIRSSLKPVASLPLLYFGMLEWAPEALDRMKANNSGIEGFLSDLHRHYQNLDPFELVVDENLRNCPYTFLFNEVNRINTLFPSGRLIFDPIFLVNQGNSQRDKVELTTKTALQLLDEQMRQIQRSLCSRGKPISQRGMSIF